MKRRGQELHEPLQRKKPNLSAAQNRHDLARMDTDVLPDNVSIASHTKVTWKCPKGHIYECGKCWCVSRYKRHASLAQEHPNLAKEWHEDNDQTPDQVSAMSGKVVKWKCQKDHVWEAPVERRSKGSGCPDCYKESLIWTSERMRTAATIDNDTGCHYWPSTVRLTHHGRQWEPHALALFLATGERTTEEKPHVCHSCGHGYGRGNCVNPLHLRVDSVANNMADKISHGTVVYGEAHPMAKLSDREAAAIFASSDAGKVLADRYGVDAETIRLIRKGHSHSWATTGQHTHIALLEKKRALRKARIASRTPDDFCNRLEYAIKARSETAPAQPNDDTVHLDTDCILWTGYINRFGYGTIGVKGTMYSVHALSAIVHHNQGRPIPKGMVVRHLCKAKHCFNHLHLRIGSYAENSMDCVRARAKVFKLTEDNVRYIRTSSDSTQALSQRFNVSKQTIRDVRKGRSWSHIT